MSQYSEIADRINDADAILVAAANGMSASEGFRIFANDEEFRRVFGDFEDRYGVHSILDGLTGRWPSEEVKWAFIARLMDRYCTGYSGSEVMDLLRKVVGDRPCHILTTNIEGHFELAGFDPDDVYDVEGTVLGMRCAMGCDPSVLPTMGFAREAAPRISDCRIPSDLVPRCPRCGGRMEIYTGVPAEKRVEDSWNGFVRRFHGKKVVVLELGVGPRNTTRAAALQLAASEPGYTYVSVNPEGSAFPKALEGRSYSVRARIDEALSAMDRELAVSEFVVYETEVTRERLADQRKGYLESAEKLRAVGIRVRDVLVGTPADIDPDAVDVDPRTMVCADLPVSVYMGVVVDRGEYPTDQILVDYLDVPDGTLSVDRKRPLMPGDGDPSQPCFIRPRDYNY